MNGKEKCRYLKEIRRQIAEQNDIALVRRVTGGGAVYHDLGNLNYTIVGRAADLNRDYPEYTRYMLQALQALGVEAELSGRNDILVGGRKVSGYAKRVYKDRLMVHGTLMYDVDLEQLTRVLTPPTEKLLAKGRKRDGAIGGQACQRAVFHSEKGVINLVAPGIHHGCVDAVQGREPLGDRLER